MKRGCGWRSGLAAACVLSVLVACESKVTMDNYKQIKANMTLAQVEAFLGSGSEEAQSGGRSIDAAGLMSSRAPTDRVFVWKDKSKKIVVTFVKDKVVGMNQEGLE